MASEATKAQWASDSPLAEEEKMADQGSSLQDPEMSSEEQAKEEFAGDVTNEKQEVEATADTPKQDDDPGYVTGWRLFMLMSSVTLAAFLMLLDISIIVTAIPRITTQFHSLPDVGWYGSAYSLSSAALQPLAGKFYTYFRTKWTFLTFIFIFEVGSLICALAVSSKMLIIGRAVAGLGSSGLMNGALTILAYSTPMEKRPALFGICMGGSQLGIVAGPLVGGALTQFTTWRWCFYINLPLGALVCGLIFLTNIPDRRTKTEDTLFQLVKSKFDIIGFLIFAPAAIMILLAVQWGGTTYPWKSATVIGLLCGGVANAVVFVLWEWHVGEDAMMPLHIIGQREMWASCLSFIFLFWGVVTAAFFLPIYFQTVKDASPFTSGVDLLPVLLSQLVFGIMSGFSIQKVGYYLPFAVLSGVVLSVGNGLLTTFGPNTGTATWAGYQILVGFGRGLGMQAPIIAVQANTKPSVTAVATAVLVFSQTFGGAIAIAIANSVFDNKLESELSSRLPPDLVGAVIEAGAKGFREVTPAKYLPQVLLSYCKGVDAALYVAVAGAAGLTLAAFGTGWKDIRKKNGPKPGDA